jgi:hypothetical protein
MKPPVSVQQKPAISYIFTFASQSLLVIMSQTDKKKSVAQIDHKTLMKYYPKSHQIHL